VENHAYVPGEHCCYLLLSADDVDEVYKASVLYRPIRRSQKKKGQEDLQEAAEKMQRNSSVPAALSQKL
jgi:hypothetical protein